MLQEGGERERQVCEGMERMGAGGRHSREGKRGRSAKRAAGWKGQRERKREREGKRGRKRKKERGKEKEDRKKGKREGEREKRTGKKGKEQPCDVTTSIGACAVAR